LLLLLSLKNDGHAKKPNNERCPVEGNLVLRRFNAWLGNPQTHKKPAKKTEKNILEGFD